MTRTESIRAAFHDQARRCRSMGSPFTARLCEFLADGLDDTTAFGRRILGWPGDPAPHGDALALRACGALHRLARSGDDAGLAALYAEPSEAGERLAPVVVSALARFDERLAADLDRVPQTSEIGRSAVLLGAALTLTEDLGKPIELLEIGAAAGLNLHFDRHLYDLGVGAWGERGAPIAVACDWRGAIPPLGAPLTVVARAGCDHAPVDPADPVAREDMLSWIWPDQSERLRRTAAAFDLAARHGPTIDRADAADWLEERLAEPPLPGVVRLVFHTVVRRYLTPETRDRIDLALEAAGRRATAAAPLAHLAMEADDTPDSAAVRLTVWPDGDVREIGRADFHGRHVAWRGQRSRFVVERP